MKQNNSIYFDSFVYLNKDMNSEDIFVDKLNKLNNN